MTLVFIARSAATRAATRRTTTHLLSNTTISSSSQLRKIFTPSTIRTLSYLSNKRPSKQKMREWNIAIASGVILVASYISLSNHYLSDSGDKIRSFSSVTSANQEQISSSNANANGNTGSKLYLLNEDEVTRRLRANEESYFVKRGQGVVRYDISQLPSNNPIEDDRSESIITVPLKSEPEAEESDFYFWGIYDGHSGPYTSSKLREELITSVVNELGLAYKIDPENPDIRLQPSEEAVDLAIKNGFLKLDHQIVQESLLKLVRDPLSKENVINALPASSGSCGLLTFYNSENQNLKVAVTGDSRALLGSLNKNNEWTVKSLSIDQTGDNPEEVARILEEHPNEKGTAVRNGRVLGSLQPTRAFGDFRYKVKEIEGFKIEDLPDHLKFYFRASPRNLLTPPYVTAEPVISTTKVNPGKNDFLVIGSDGLYELLSNEEIVGLVVKWLEKNEITKNNYSKEEGSHWAKLFQKNADDKKLPKVLDISDPKYREIQRPPFRNKKNNEQHEYLLEDVNVSTHLIRNALSLGGSKEYVSTLVSIPSPTSRKYRDDLTVTVVFFGEQQKDQVDGQLDVNLKATKSGKLQEKL